MPSFDPYRYNPNRGGGFRGGYPPNRRGSYPGYGGGQGGHGGQNYHRGQYPGPHSKPPRRHPDNYGGQPHGYREPHQGRANHYVGGQDRNGRNGYPAHPEKQHYDPRDLKAHYSPKYNHFDSLLQDTGSRQRKLNNWITELEKAKRYIDNKVSDAKRFKLRGMDSQAKKCLEDANGLWKKWERKLR